MSESGGFLGILSLDTAFQRVVGDAGNPDSYPFAARVRIVPGADSPDIVRDGVLDPETERRVVRAALVLQSEGALAIVSTCGFLASAQPRVAAALDTPVMLSALSLFPLAAAASAGPVGILTASRAALGRHALQAAGVRPEDARIAGLEDVPAFADSFLQPKPRQAAALDRSAVEAAVLGAARGLIAATPGIGALLLECGNLPPYAAALRRATGRPVFDILGAARLLMDSRRP